MTTQYTPKWTEPRIYSDPSGYTYRVTIYSRGNDRHFMTTVSPDATDIANLTLAAAAPELLEACQTLLQQLQYLVSDGVIPAHVLTNTPCIAIARAAITKATGGHHDSATYARPVGQH